MLRKTTALLLLIVLIFTNNVIAVQSAFDYTLQPSTGNAPGSSDFDSNVNNAVGAGNSLANAYISEAKENLNIDWLRRLDLSLSYNNTLNTWLYGASMIQPFAWSFDPTASDMLFFQLNAQKDSTNFYGNAGIGYRTLFLDRKSLIGINAFFDEDFQNQNQRIGAGIEYFNRLAEVRANGYYGYSKPKFISEDDSYWYYQQVTNGFDFGVSLNVPSAEWLKLNATGYTNMYQYVPWTTGAVFDIQAQVLPQLQLEYGYNISSGTTSSTSQFFKFNFNLGGVIGPVLFGSSNETKAIVDKDLSYKLLQPVQRNNIIVTENYKVAKTGIIYAYVNYTDGTPVPTGTSVSATSTTGAVATATTNSLGLAAFGNLPTGNYIVSSNISGQPFVAVPNPVTVTSATVATASITGPTNPATGELNVTFTYTDTTAISGATVTINNGQGVTVQATTNSSGVANFLGLLPGAYSVMAVLGGNSYPGNPVTVVNGQAAASAITGPNNPSKGYANIKVTYLNGTAVPVDTAVTMTAGSVTAGPISTDVNGIATFVGLLPGSYSASATVLGVVCQTTGIAVVAGQPSSATIIGQANPDPTTGSIQTTVTFNDGVAVAGSTVTAENDSSKLKYYGITNSNGIATVSNLPPGNYNVSALVNGGTYKNSSKIAVIVSNDPAIAIINEPTDPNAGKLAVTLEYIDGNHYKSDVDVTVTTSTGVISKQTVSNGQATIANLAAGSCKVTAVVGTSTTQTVVIVANNTTPIVFTGGIDPDLGAFSVTVIDNSGLLISNQPVTATATHLGISRTSPTGANGEAAQISSLPTSYEYIAPDGEIFVVPETYTVVTYSDSLPYKSPDSQVALNPSEVKSQEIVINNGYLKTRFSYGDGTPIASQSVSIQGLDSLSTFTKTVTTNSRGYVATEGSLTDTLKLPVGNYTVSTILYATTYTSSPDPVAILASNTEDNPKVANIAGPPNPDDFGTITATALYGDNSPMYGWDVKAISTTDSSYYRISNTDTSGIATFANLKSGQYYVYIRKSGTEEYPPSPITNWVSQPYEVVCQAKQIAYCNITGPATSGVLAVVQVTAKYADGTPMNGWEITSTNVDDSTSTTARADANGVAFFRYSTSGAYTLTIKAGGTIFTSIPPIVYADVGKVKTCIITGP